MLWFGLFEMSLLWMWLIVIAGSILVTAFVDADRPGGATSTVLGVLLLLHFGHVVNILSVFHSPLPFIGLLLGYLAVGVLWAVMKWMFHLDHWKRESVSAIRKAKVEFLASRKLGGNIIPEQLIPEWKKYTEGKTFYRDSGDHYRSSASADELIAAPKVSDNKSRLVTWGIYWPFSMVWTIINDPVRRFYQYIILHVLGGFMQRLSDKKQADVKRELGA